MDSSSQVHAIFENLKPKICAVCSVNDALYTCPRCAMRTCSLGCCKAHKATYNCSGKRNVAAFVDKRDYNYFHFLSDYRFLESVDRQNESIAEQINENRRLARSRRKVQSRIRSMARPLGIQYRSSKSALLTRARLNQTHVVDDKSPYILWTLEFCLIPVSSIGSQSEIHPWSDSLLKPIHVLLHDCDSNSLISVIWKSKLVDLPSIDQDSLAIPDLTSFSDPNNSTPSVTSWTLPLGDKPPYFYIECFDKNTKQYSKHEIFPSSTRLMDVLKWENYIVKEFPTIWVSQKEFTL
ncbi:hypothetical protein Aperf_G00000112250 [Anoplocephala perfoliata]